MEKALNYPFQRRSANYFEWLYEVIKSEKYFQADSVIVSKEIKRRHT
ncbi:hypothetical protein [Ulvibacter sp. MAR_2010_11]|nr:hypothetical protein [Ulvibacter sp. MAR_2010_11]